MWRRQKEEEEDRIANLALKLAIFARGVEAWRASEGDARQDTDTIASTAKGPERRRTRQGWCYI